MPVLPLRTMPRRTGLTRETLLRTLVKTTDQPMSSTTQVDITDLLVRIGAAQILHFHAYLVCSAAATTTGIQLGVNGPASPTQVEATIMGWSGVSTLVTTGVSAYETFQGNTDSPGTTRRIFEIAGRIINGTTRGTFALRVRSEVGGSAVTVHKGSWLEIFNETQPTQRS